MHYHTSVTFHVAARKHEMELHAQIPVLKIDHDVECMVVPLGQVVSREIKTR